MAIKNANDGISMAQTADGAYGQVTSMLQRMRELAVQAANGAVSAADRGSIQLEIDELKAEINNVADRTNFNGIKLLDGTARDVKLQTGTNEGELMSVGFGSVKAKDIGSGDNPALTSVGGNQTTFGNLSAGDLVINGVQVNASLATDDEISTASQASSAIAKVAAINRVTDQSGVFAKVNDTTVGGQSMTGAATSGTLTINGYTTATFATTLDLATSRANTVKAINDISGATGVVAIDTGDDKQGVKLVAADSRNIVTATNFSASGNTGVAAVGTYVGSYSLYSQTGGSISINHQVGKTQANFNNTGLRIGSFESGEAVMVTARRAVVATGMTAGSTTSTAGILNGDTLKLNDIAIMAARDTDDTASINTGASTESASLKAASAIAIASAINSSSHLHGVTAKADANVLRGTGFTSLSASFAVKLNGVDITVNTITRDNVLDALNAKTGQTGVEARAFGEGIELVAKDGRNIFIGIDSTAGTAANLGLTGIAVGSAATATAHQGYYASVVLSSDKAFSVQRGNEGGTNFDTLGFRVGTFGGKDTGMKVAEADVTTQLGAGMAITAIDAAIDDVASAQARSGAFQNRLDAAVNILSESSENASAARSRILDTDYATETTALAKAQIVQQAATAMLAQANQQQQSVLALLQ
jgi:flagellin